MPCDQHNTIPISTYTLSVLCPVTNTTQFQNQLTHCQCCALWPTQHNSNFCLHTYRVVPFTQHNTIPVSTYTLSVLCPLANTTQFQFLLTHFLCCALWPTQHNSNFYLHTFCVVPFGQHNTIPISTYTLCCALWPTQQNSNFNSHTVCHVQFIHKL